MSALVSRPALRWLVPFSAALAVIGGGVAVGALTAAAEPKLAPRSAAQLLVDLQTARLDGLSGTVVARANLGLPALPGIGIQRPGQGSAELGSLLGGTHTLRVWYSGPDKARVALLGTLGETDLITNGDDLWIWSSRENKATHRTLPSRDRAERPSLPPAGAMTPQQLADAALAAIGPTTRVSTDGSAQVAGRGAHELVLSPRDAASRVGSVRLAVDAKEHVPLRVQVFARGGDEPAIEVAFTQVSFERPADSQFTFNPPPGATVVEEGAGTGRHPDSQTEPQKQPQKQPQKRPQTDAKTGQPTPGDTRHGPAIVGKGWTSVLVASLPEPAAVEDHDGKGLDPSMLRGLVERLPRVSGTWGSGHLLTSALFSVLVTDDGRVLLGAVDPERLYQAAADPAAQVGE